MSLGFLGGFGSELAGPGIGLCSFSFAHCTQPQGGHCKPSAAASYPTPLSEWEKACDETAPCPSRATAS